MIYTPEFIKLASHPEIQKMLQEDFDKMADPEAMLVNTIFTGIGKILNPHPYFCDKWPENCDAPYILLPDLSWLVRKLMDTGAWPEFRGGMNETTYTVMCVWLESSADTPELAALKALCKIKGIEV